MKSFVALTFHVEIANDYCLFEEKYKVWIYCKIRVLTHKHLFLSTFKLFVPATKGQQFMPEIIHVGKHWIYLLQVFLIAEAFLFSKESATLYVLGSVTKETIKASWCFNRQKG